MFVVTFGYCCMLNIVTVLLDICFVLISFMLWLAAGSVTKPSSVVKMPAPIERCVRKQNVLYLHNRNQFSAEYFRFMRRLLLCNIPHGQQTGDEKLVSLTISAVRSARVRL